MNKENYTTEDASKIGNKLGLKWKQIKPQALSKGMDVEEEHNDNEKIDGVNPNVIHGDTKKVAKIAIAHLGESPDYYKKLKVIEDKKELIKNRIKSNVYKNTKS